MYNVIVGKHHPWKKEINCHILGFFQKQPTKEQLILLFEEKNHQYNDGLIDGLLKNNVGYLNDGEFEDDEYFIEKVKDRSNL